MGFGQEGRLIASGQQNNGAQGTTDLKEASFIEEIKAANQAWMMSNDGKHDQRDINLSVPGAYDPVEVADRGNYAS